VPETVARIAGPAGGGAVLVGGAGQIGLTLVSGQVQDLAFDGFAKAIQADSGSVRLTNLRITNTDVAIGAAKAAGEAVLDLKIENLDVSGGTIGRQRCVVGLHVDGPTELTATGLVMHDIGAAVFALAQKPEKVKIDLTGANVSAIESFSPCNSGVFELRGVALTLRDSIVSGGGLAFNFYSSATLTIIGSTIRDQGFGLSGFDSTVQVTDSMFVNTSVFAEGGNWSFAGVTIEQGKGLQLATSSAQTLTFKLRDSKISASETDGISIVDDVSADLGTVASPGNNMITGNTGVGLAIVGPRLTNVSAVGNTWNATVQGADADGHYFTSETLTGPLTRTAGNNFALVAGATLLR
jgi:hypothetical protein